MPRCRRLSICCQRVPRSRFVPRAPPTHAKTNCRWVRGRVSSTPGSSKLRFHPPPMHHMSSTICLRVWESSGKRARPASRSQVHRPVQVRADPPRRALARRRPSRGRHCLLGAVVQHRTHPRLHRRPHAPRGRTTRLRSQRTGRTSRLTPAKHSPDTPGRVSLQSVRRDFSYRHNGDLSLRHLTNELVQRNVRLRKSGVLQALAKSTTSQSAPSEVAASSASFRSRTISNGSCQARSSSTSSNPIKIA